MNKFIGFSFLFQRILLMILAIGFFGMALGAGHQIDTYDFAQLKMYFFLLVFAITYFFLRAVRRDKASYSNFLHWSSFCLLFICCYGLMEMLADIWNGDQERNYFLITILLIGIVNGLFLCCVFLSRRQV